jgi:hypothetical protein
MPLFAVINNPHVQTEYKYPLIMLELTERDNGMKLDYR